MALQTSDAAELYQNPKSDRRKEGSRICLPRVAEWDFFTSGVGGKPGFIENISSGGCLLRTTEPIEHRRWIRIIIRDDQRKLYFTCVGRAVHCSDRLQAWDDRHITLYRLGIEFVHTLNPMILEGLNVSLKRACHNLLMEEGLEPA